MSYFGDSPTSRQIALSFNKLKRACELESDIRKRCLTLLMLSTGLRVEEAVLQRWSHGWSQWDYKYIVIQAETVKGKKKARAVPYVAMLKRQMKKLHRVKESEYLFTGRTKWGMSSRREIAITTRTAQRWIKQTGALTGMSQIEAHDLRRIFATRYLDRSNDFFTTMKLLGHEKPGTTMIYILEWMSRAYGIVTKIMR